MDLIDSFPGYTKPTTTQTQEAWRTALVSFDANVLLNFYRYSQRARSALMEIIRRMGKRVWVSHRAALEFHENRLKVIETQIKTYSDTKDLVTKLATSLSDPHRHPFVDSTLQKTSERLLKDLLDALSEGEKAQENRLQEDDLIKDVALLLAGCISKEPDLVSGEKYKQAAKERLEKKIPPGYCDTKKEGERPLGDGIMWLQLLDKASADKCDLIFVTDDQKDDWWVTVRGKRLGPRAELAAEYRARTGKALYLYTPARFIEAATVNLNIDRDESVIEEARQVSIERAHREHSSVFREPLRTLVDLARHAAKHREHIDLFVEMIRELPVDLRSSDSLLVPLPDDLRKSIKNVLDRCPCIERIAFDISNMPNPIVNALWDQLEKRIGRMATRRLQSLWQLTTPRESFERLVSLLRA